MGLGEEDEVAMRRLRFFKIMMPGFEERLRLPAAFSEKLKQVKSSKRVILESCKGTWEINVSRDEDDDDVMFLEDGWSRFVDEHGLSVGDFLVFEHTQHLHFNVLVFEPNAWEKQFSVEPLQPLNLRQEILHDGKAEEKSLVHTQSQRPYFTVEMTPHFATTSKVTIPLEFVMSNNLGQKKSVTLSVRDGRGRSRRWDVKLNITANGPHNFQMRLGGGWQDFYACNELQVGDVCLFELINPTPPTSTSSSSILFDVQIFRASSIDP